MNNGKSMLIGALVGGAIGWVLGNILADHFAPEYYTEEEMEQMKEMVEPYSQKEDELGPEMETARIYVGAKEKNKEKGVKKLPTNYNEMYDSAGERIPVEKLVEKFNDPDFEEDVEEEDYEEVDIPEEPIAGDYGTYFDSREEENTYIMQEEDWILNESGFKQATLNYYPEDDVLTDMKDRPVDNIERVIGEEAISNFGTFSEDPEIVYICNRKLKMEYEVINQGGSYSWKVNGVDPLDVPKKTVVIHNVFEDYEDPSLSPLEEEIEDEQD